VTRALAGVSAARRPLAGRGAIVVERSVVADVPAEDVFDLLADVRNEERWNPNVVRIEVETAGPPRVGTRFEGRYRRGGRMTFEITGYDRPSRLVFHGGGRRLGLVAVVTVAAGEQGTSVALRAVRMPRGPFKPLAPVMRPLVERQYADAARRLRAFVEAGRSVP
jgi:uncharacterized protein YndB with AHSA1/START domain